MVAVGVGESFLAKVEKEFGWVRLLVENDGREGLVCFRKAGSWREAPPSDLGSRAVCLCGSSARRLSEGARDGHVVTADAGERVLWLWVRWSVPGWCG